MPGGNLDVDKRQALPFRVVGHHLHERTEPLTAVAACGLQEHPPGWAVVALHARASGELDPDEVVTVNAMRGAAYVLPRTDVAVFAAALVPDEEGLPAFVGGSTAAEVAEAGFSVREALELVETAAREGLDAGPLDRDAFHQALRERLPDGLLPWCRGCRSHHVRPGPWRALGLFPPVGRPGVVLHDGAFAGLWRGRKKGDVLEVEIEWLAPPVDVSPEADAVGRLRGCRTVALPKD